MAEFSDKETCLQYLADRKWKNGFKCAHCGHTAWAKVRDTLHRKCNRCKHIESPTAGTVFHKVKFALPKAFFIVFMVSTGKKGLSSHELSRKLTLRQKTCFHFKRKAMAAMHLEDPEPLQGKLEMDTFAIRGKRKHATGRTSGPKKEVVMAIQTSRRGILRCYAKQINGAGTKQLKPFFEKHISRSASIRTKKWRGYKPLTSSYPKLVQQKSRSRKGFRLFHRQQMMLKAWLRGIHHHADHIQPYLDEFNWRFNNRKALSLFDLLLNSMMKRKPILIKNLNDY